MRKRFTLIEARTLLGFHDDNKKLDRWMAKLKIVPLLYEEVPFDELEIGQQDRRMKFITDHELDCLARTLGISMNVQLEVEIETENPQREITRLKAAIAELREQIKKLNERIDEKPASDMTPPVKDAVINITESHLNGSHTALYSSPTPNTSTSLSKDDHQFTDTQSPDYGSLANGYMRDWEGPLSRSRRQRGGPANPPMPEEWESLNAFGLAHDIPDTDIRRWRDLRLFSFHAGKWRPRKGAKPVEYALDPEQQQELLQLRAMPDYDRALLIKDARARLAMRAD